MEEAINELSIELLKGFVDLVPFIFSFISDLRGMVSSEAIKLVFVPFYDFSLINVFMSLIYAIVLWRNRGMIVSGLSHMLHLGEWVLSVFQKVRRP